MSSETQQLATKALTRSPFQKERKPTPELIDSVKQHGIIQPLVVRPVAQANGVTHELIAGERRWWAALANKLQLVPVIVRQASDIEARELQTTENLQRADYNPIEEAEAYHGLLESYKAEGIEGEKAIARLCEKVGKSKAAVYEKLSLLKLAPAVKEKVGTVLPASHAALLVKLPAEMQAELIEVIAPATQDDKTLRKIESDYSLWDADRDESGVLSFRSAKEMVNERAALLGKRAEWLKLADKHRAGGGEVLTDSELNKAVTHYGHAQGAYVTVEEYTYDYSAGPKRYRELMGKHAPKQILSRTADYRAVYLVRKSDAIAAIEKNGHKRKPSAGPVAGPRAPTAEERAKAEEREKLQEAVAAQLRRELVKAAERTKPKFPWPLLVRLIIDCGANVAQDFYDERKLKVFGDDAKLRKLVESTPANKMPALLLSMFFDAQEEFDYSGGGGPNAIALLKHYRIDPKKIEKELAPKGAPTKQPKPKVQTAGKAKGKRTKQPKVSKKTLLSAAGRKRLAAAMKARWAARRKAAAKS